ncbi:MAG: cobalamin biosynthesis protein, partial [Negativicutes bacterium]|nr:cobalamin biosynthesis protein [Negativicutes bacterium]
ASLTVNGKKGLYFVDETLPDVELYRKRAQEMSVTLLEMSQMNQMEYDGAVVITDHRIIHTTPVLFLRPPALVAGIGCRRGTNGQKILKALRQVMAEEGRSLRSLQRLASVDVKEDEIGLLSVADQLELPISFYSADELELPIREFNLVESEFVKKQIGVGNVCEAAAILASNQGELIVKRKDFEGITIALARVRF